MENTLIVHYDPIKVYSGLFITLIVTIAFIFLFFFISNLESHIGFYLVILLQIILLFFVATFSFGLICGYFWNLKKPAAILSPKGIWINRFSFIPWDNITGINTYMFGDKPANALGIRLKNPEIVFKQAKFEGKSVLFWAKLFGYQYHIHLSCLALKNEEILNYARQFIPRN